MKTIFYLAFFYSALSFAQVYEFVSTKNNKRIFHRIKIDKEYLIETQYIKEPTEFILTRGGYYKKKGKTYNIELEFNSNFQNDGFTIIDLRKGKSWLKSGVSIWFFDQGLQVWCTSSWRNSFRV